MDFVHQTVAFIAAHPVLAGLVIGGLAFGESMVLIGILIPGTAVLVVVGGLIGAGVISPWPALIGAAIGAAAGDTLSFYLGIWAGRSAVNRWPLVRYRRSVALARLFFKRFGVASVFVGRFFGPVRATVPLVAGMLRMAPRRFQFANVSSAIVWAPVILSPGWLAARSWGRIIRWSEADWFVPALVGTAIALIATAIGWWLHQRSKAARKRASGGVGA